MTHVTTHLVAATAFGPKYSGARARGGVAIVTLSWVSDCAAQTALLPTEPYALPIFAGVRACITGFSKARRAALKQLILQHGGSFEGDMDLAVVTHLIAEQPKGSKFAAAVASRGSCAPVSADWVEASVAAKAGLPAESFPVQDVAVADYSAEVRQGRSYLRV